MRPAEELTDLLTDLSEWLSALAVIRSDGWQEERRTDQLERSPSRERAREIC